MQTISTTAIENNSQRISQESAENLNLAIWFENKDITSEHGVKVDFKKLNELIEHSDVQRLDISIHHPIFLEIKKIFEVILKIDRSSINGWKYKNTFLSVQRSHYDNFEAKKVQFVTMNWIDSFVTSFIMHLYH
jgi:hypothetical protein